MMTNRQNEEKERKREQMVTERNNGTLAQNQALVERNDDK